MQNFHALETADVVAPDPRHRGFDDAAFSCYCAGQIRCAGAAAVRTAATTAPGKPTSPSRTQSKPTRQRTPSIASIARKCGGVAHPKTGAALDLAVLVCPLCPGRPRPSTSPRRRFVLCANGFDQPSTKSGRLLNIFPGEVHHRDAAILGHRACRGLSFVFSSKPSEATAQITVETGQ